ncbi:hypothetical protein LJC08_05330 [Methanimicrococcus sp. OttesenSCG-928-J09]|nr:hypothetical protein [Methanimicrococcus sp. OttesenSCG-928-J09]
MKQNSNIYKLVFVILIIVLAVLIWSGLTNQQESKDKETIPLEITYWNPEGGQIKSEKEKPVIMSMDYPTYELRDYIAESPIIVSATVTKSIEWTDITEEGKSKIEELDSPWVTNYSKECYMDINEILKGDIENDRIYLKTDIKEPEFKVGEEYILFIYENEDSTYIIHNPRGYLVKTGFEYKGKMDGEENITLPITKSYLKKLNKIPYE